MDRNLSYADTFEIYSCRFKIRGPHMGRRGHFSFYILIYSTTWISQAIPGYFIC